MKAENCKPRWNCSNMTTQWCEQLRSCLSSCLWVMQVNAPSSQFPLIPLLEVRYLYLFPCIGMTCCPFYLGVLSLARNSIILRMFKAAKEGQIDFYLLKAKFSWSSYNLIILFPVDAFWKKRATAASGWWSRWTKTELGKKGRRWVVFAMVDSCSLIHTCIRLLYEVGRSMKITLEITLPFPAFIIH